MYFQVVRYMPDICIYYARKQLTETQKMSVILISCIFNSKYVVAMHSIMKLQTSTV